MVSDFNMTAVPPWVGVGNATVEKSSKKLRSKELVLSKISPIQPDSIELTAQEIVFNKWAIKCDSRGTLVYTITSKEEIFHISNKPYFIWPSQRSYWTCELCPQPLGRTVEAFGYLKRCRECNTTATRYKRAKRLVKDIGNMSKHFGMKPKWITLTLPNYNEPLEGLADLKKKVRKFRHSKEYQEKVIGSADFYEWTESTDGTYNVHYHAIWIGNYWKQKDLMKAWKHGGARIEDCGSQKKRVNYCVSYAKKQAALGIRTSQRTGCLYGPVFHALNKYLQTQAGE